MPAAAAGQSSGAPDEAKEVSTGLVMRPILRIAPVSSGLSGHSVLSPRAGTDICTDKQELNIFTNGRCSSGHEEGDGRGIGRAGRGRRDGLRRPGGPFLLFLVIHPLRLHGGVDRASPRPSRTCGDWLLKTTCR